MSLEQTTELYASVLRQLLPEGVYDTAEMTHVADDIYAHAKALAQADIDAHRLLQVLETIPVDLLADYEREYGLPMQCMVPGSQTIEERISVLRWIRQHRNVMNREYLEQILAIFGVTLVDVVKHHPMQCTAPCTAPVNTERLRYKVLLRLQYPMTADMSCIIESYLPGYLRVEWVVDMPWGEWILNNGYSLVGNNIRYTAYKTNQQDFYDSYANFDLITALVRSFHDTDMQQWQAVINACNELTSVTDWTFDTENIKYRGDLDKSITSEYYWDNGAVGKIFYDPDESCLATFYHIGLDRLWDFVRHDNGQCLVRNKTDGRVVDGGGSGARLNNPLYNPNAQAEEKTISFDVIAQKIISNSQSSNQAISLLAEAFLDVVAKSICNSDGSKQFIKLTDLISQFEFHKILRT